MGMSSHGIFHSHTLPAHPGPGKLAQTPLGGQGLGNLSSGACWPWWGLPSTPASHGAQALWQPQPATGPVTRTLWLFLNESSINAAF